MPDDESSTLIPASKLRWTIDCGRYDFDTTEEINPSDDVRAQETAREALEFGLTSTARKQNIYVRGSRGTGRRTMVRQILSLVPRPPSRRLDRCYVQNFKQPDQPRLISLGAGMGRVLRRRMRGFAEFVERDLPKVLESEPLKSEVAALEGRVKSRVTEITEPLEKDLEEAGMKLVTMQQGQMPRTLIFPSVSGEPVPPGQLQQMVAQGKAPAEQLSSFEEQLPEFEKRLREVGLEVARIQREGYETLQKLTETAAREVLDDYAAEIRSLFDNRTVDEFLNEVIENVIETRPGQGSRSLIELYGVNVVLEHGPHDTPPIIEETTPTATSLLGTIEVTWDHDGPSQVDYSGVRAGALLRADGGYLILDVNEILAEPGAWRALMRTLRTGQLEIAPPDAGWFRPQQLLNPEPIDIDVRVVLIGDSYTYYRLDAVDPDFGEMFKVLADFDPEIDRDEAGIEHYVRVIAGLIKRDELLPFHCSGIGALTEHGARIASRRDKLTARFGRIGDIAREASFLAEKANARTVSAEHVTSAIRRTKRRASLPSRKFQELIQTGTIRVETEGAVVGQINGLAVISAGPITYGFPARITSSIGVGRAGIIDIEASASLSGSIHTKGFHILGGLLRHLIKTDHPLAFTASLAFEQSYGGIDGDSASGAEICCLLSALTNVPIRQSFAMTGAIDQHGRIQAIGGVNEKIEGFFDTCAHFGLTGDQGVVIPKSNAGDLMLRHDVVEACSAGQFAVHAVETVHEALEVLTGKEAGGASVKSDGSLHYPPGSLLGLAVERANQYWVKAMQTPQNNNQGSPQSKEPSESPKES